MLGLDLSLKSLAGLLRIPSDEGAFHCAGNDAHYTMRVLLALVQLRCSDPHGMLEKLVRGALPERLVNAGKEVVNDWEVHLDDGMGSLWA